jgi:hypothetical protein
MNKFKQTVLCIATIAAAAAASVANAQNVVVGTEVRAGYNGNTFKPYAMVGGYARPVSQELKISRHQPFDVSHPGVAVGAGFELGNQNHRAIADFGVQLPMGSKETKYRRTNIGVGYKYERELGDKFELNGSANLFFQTLDIEYKDKQANPDKIESRQIKGAGLGVGLNYKLSQQLALTAKAGMNYGEAYATVGLNYKVNPKRNARSMHHRGK